MTIFGVVIISGDFPVRLGGDNDDSIEDLLLLFLMITSFSFPPGCCLVTAAFDEGNDGILNSIVLYKVVTNCLLSVYVTGN